MQKKEYGSDFIIEESIGNLNEIYREDNIAEFMLGRTALDAIIQDVMRNNLIQCVLLPSYCCHTMIEPFARYGLEIKFYDIVVSEIDGIDYCIDYNEKFDMVLVMQYFGFHSKQFSGVINRLKKAEKIVIEDATHSILQRHSYSYVSDYVFVSYRKWMGTNGGAVVIKRNGKLEKPQNQDTMSTYNAYLELKKTAFIEKKNYLSCNMVTTKKHLVLFGEAERIIEKEYAGFPVDADSKKIIRYTNYQKMKEARVKNASYLLQELAKIPLIDVMFSQITDEDTPLFVPILLPEVARTDLRQYLIERNIFLPIHWPLSELHNISDIGKRLYKEELSIICDQRYDVEDMKYIVSQIREWEKTYERIRCDTNKRQ